MRILILEDRVTDYELAVRELRAERFEFTAVRVETERDFRGQIAEFAPDLILADHSLPSYDGLSALAVARQLCPAVPFLFLSGTMGEEVAIEALQHGATDYVLKQRLGRLGPAVRRALGEVAERRQRLEAEAQLREQARLLDLAHDAILVRDLDHRVTYWNRGAEHLYGWPAAEVLGQPVTGLCCRESPEFRQAMDEVLAKGTWAGQLTQTTRAGTEIVASSRWTLVRDAQNQPHSVLVINTDITEQKHLEAQFLRAQRLESIGQLASGIAHDLNNLLAPILLSAPLLRYDLPAAERDEMLGSIERSAEQAAALIRQLLAFGRGHTGDRLTVQLRHLIRDVLAVARSTFPRSIQIESSIPKDLWLVTADPNQMHQVLLNLCVNARDAMPQGGRLTLVASHVTFDQQMADLQTDARPGPYVCLAVSDTGAGIKPELLGRIFEPFFTTKDEGKGTGLGLATVRRIVTSHGGFVRVFSELGVGSTFEVFLPATPDTVEPAREPGVRPAHRPGEGWSILVVDDELPVRQTLRKTLEQHGYTVHLAADGIEALSLLTHQALIVHAVITDRMMPLMDGVALARILSRLRPGVPIILSTGLDLGPTHPGEPPDPRLEGFAAILSKPFNADTLLDALEAALPSSPHRPAA